MSIPGSAEPLLLAQSGGYQIERSLRFNSSDSAYLSRTPASAGNRKTWTWSGWVKRSALTNNQQAIFSLGAYPADLFEIRFESGEILQIDNTPSSTTKNLELRTSAVFRDTSAWYHIVFALDTTQATASDRAKLYVNGQQTTAFSTGTYPSQNADLNMNTAVVTRIGNRADNGTIFSGYLADIHFIDGQALTPSSFAETNTTTGQWVPKAYSGTYGTNGFQLKFADNSAATATTLGKDTSGNGNNWTPNNLSVTAGADNDSLVDTPTSYGTDTGAGGEVRGNYCTWNPLRLGTAQTLTNGNLDIGGTANGITLGTIYVSSGKWYYEAQGGVTSIGIATNACPLVYGSISSNIYYHYNTGGSKYDGNMSSTYGASFGAGDIIGVAFDLDAGTLTFYKNGVSQGTAFTGISGSFAPAILTNETIARSYNFGQRPFAYTAPSGFKALCDTNLPAPVVTKPSTVMDVATYTGDNTNNRTITTSNSSLKSGLVWIKSRSAAYNHILFDSLRGTGNYLATNSTGAENFAGSLSWTNSGPTGSNSFKVDYGTNPTLNELNSTYVGWVFDAGSSTVTNTQGSITSQVRANASAGFSIVTYSAGATNATVGHGLGVAPGLIIVKSRTVVVQWVVYHSSLGKDGYLHLDLTFSFGALSNYWGIAGPNSTTFGLSNNGFGNNLGDMVAYCFAPVAGYSSFGSYTGNGSADGPFVYTGMRARWILLKRTDANGDWILFDAARDPKNVCSLMLFPNTADAEFSSATYLIDVLSNGFKLRQTGPSINASSGSFVYAAFAENPFQYARAR